MSDKLKPCPFCGSENIGSWWVDNYSMNSSYGMFGCESCNLGLDDSDNASDNDLAIGWNRRTTQHGYKIVPVDVLRSAVIHGLRLRNDSSVENSVNFDLAMCELDTILKASEGES